MDLLRLLDFPSFFYPVEDAFVEVIDLLEAFFNQKFGCLTAAASATAIDGYRFLFIQPFIYGKGKSCFVLHIDVEAARNVPFRKFGCGSYIHQLDVGVVNQFLKLAGGEVLVFDVLADACPHARRKEEDKQNEVKRFDHRSIIECAGGHSFFVSVQSEGDEVAKG